MFGIGDTVIFKYKEGAQTDNYTKILMRKYLIDGQQYTIKYIVKFHKYENHLKFYETDAHGFEYPESCFVKLSGSNNMYMKKKYNLK